MCGTIVWKRTRTDFESPLHKGTALGEPKLQIIGWITGTQLDQLAVALEASIVTCYFQHYLLVGHKYNAESLAFVFVTSCDVHLVAVAGSSGLAVPATTCSRLSSIISHHTPELLACRFLPSVSLLPVKTQTNIVVRFGNRKGDRSACWHISDGNGCRKSGWSPCRLWSRCSRGSRTISRPGGREGCWSASRIGNEIWPWSWPPRGPWSWHSRRRPWSWSSCRSTSGPGGWKGGWSTSREGGRAWRGVRSESCDTVIGSTFVGLSTYASRYCHGSGTFKTNQISSAVKV